MRVLLEIDDDLLNIARAIASKEGRALDAIVSELVRGGLQSAIDDKRYILTETGVWDFWKGGEFESPELAKLIIGERTL
jgi:hypothetical protein